MCSSSACVEKISRTLGNGLVADEPTILRPETLIPQTMPSDQELSDLYTKQGFANAIEFCYLS